MRIGINRAQATLSDIQPVRIAFTARLPEGWLRKAIGNDLRPRKALRSDPYTYLAGIREGNGAEARFHPVERQRPRIAGH